MISQAGSDGDGGFQDVLMDFYYNDSVGGDCVCQGVKMNSFNIGRDDGAFAGHY